MFKQITQMYLVIFNYRGRVKKGQSYQEICGCGKMIIGAGLKRGLWAWLVNKRVWQDDKRAGLKRSLWEWLDN